ncbi:MAG TPA: amidohydrolase family protein, partial [Methylomirabilota bacterium]|nr:amidohydrolase family protein [Methylomirabilota bacterium]
LAVIPPAIRAAEADVRREGESWRAQHRIIDLHQHINGTTQHLTRAVRIMDRVGVGVAVNLSGGYVTRGTNAMSEFERNKRRADTLFPGRFVQYMNLNYGGWGDAEFSERAVKQIEEGHRLGAAGLKEYKRLGLNLKDGAGKLIRIDDAKLDPVWKRCGELGLPVSIHVADPRAFWLPYDEKNERWKELKDHKSWWFGDTNKYPPRMELLEALNRVIARHPKTTFVCVHFANNAEELEWVDESLTKYPNMMADLAARIPEIGRHDPEKVRRLFIKHQDRIFFATDFQVYDRLILGSSGNEPPPTDDDAAEFFAKEWRWLETNDRDFPHMTPIQGDWTISGIGLPAPVLRKIYFDNARKLLARSLPAPVMRAARVESDFEVDGAIGESTWQHAQPVALEYESRSSTARPELSTTVRALWSEKFLYLAFECPFTTLTVFEPVQTQERFGLWERDVVEAFIASDTNNVRRYTEYEISPTNERLDVKIPEKDFAWSSGFESATRIDKQRKRWTAEARIPMSALTQTKPIGGAKWRLNLYRCDYANKAFLAFNPVLTGSFHTPERFGVLEFLP